MTLIIILIVALVAVVYIINIIERVRKESTASSYDFKYKMEYDKVNSKLKEFYAIDFETATDKRSSACALGIAKVVDGEIVETKSYLIQPPENKYNKINCSIHRIMPSHTESQPTIDKYHDEICSMLKNAILVSHNADFDASVMAQSFKHYDLKMPNFSKWYCTYKLTGLSLNNCAKMFSISLDNHHEATCDARACAQVYLCIVNEMGMTEKEVAEVRKAARLAKPKFKYTEVVYSSLTPFTGKTIVITGIFCKYPDREELKGILIKCGAKVTSVINGKTDMVVCGELAGPKKLEKIDILNSASDKRIETIDEQALIDMLVVASTPDKATVTNKNNDPIVVDAVFVAITEPSEPQVSNTPTTTEKPSKIITTEEELQGFYIVKSLLHGTIDDINRITHRDRQTYFGILLDDNNRKPICRLHLNGGKKYIELFNADKTSVKHPLESLNDIYVHAEQIKSTIGYY